MMTVPMDSSAPGSRELVQRLFNKNIELENGLRKSARMKVPSDPGAWVQMRENHEAIILEDHDFSEEHEIEYSLWQLHHRRIEEFRVHINAATSSGGKSNVRPDRVEKIRAVFKSFLSEATGFYHNLLLKIKAKYGLPLVYVSEAPEKGVLLAEDEKISLEMKKGILSCHRCLIYLGDLSRYKGIYGEGDSSRDFTAASSYYMQAASLWPSNGNPHHQLAILASYIGEELVAVYRYFRSLAANTPFSTARDNLIIAFEKNRQCYSQLPGIAKVPAKALPTRINGGGGRGRGRGRGRGDARLLTKDVKSAIAPAKEPELRKPELLKAFSTRFVRLNGILFTRTSLETFGEVLSLVLSNLSDILCSGPEEELSFGQDAIENRLVVVRLIAILIFSVHNVYKESEGQTYAEILQRAVLLQNAFSAAFEFAGHILKRCVELDDFASSYLLPAILVFMEWLACHPDIATRNDVEEKEAAARTFFWKQCVSFVNILMGSGLACIDCNDDTACFSDMSWYDEGETGNRLALWEDIELRGFTPLVPAHLILDFSRKHCLGNDGLNMEKKARVNRILAAGRSLVHDVLIDQQGIYYDCGLKKFVIGTKPPTHVDSAHEAIVDADKPSDAKQSCPDGKMRKTQPDQVNLEMRPSEQLFVEREEDEEEIVFQPSVGEKYSSFGVSKLNAYDSFNHVQNSSGGNLASYVDSVSAALENLSVSSAQKVSPELQAAVSSISQLPSENTALCTPNYLMEQESLFANGSNNLNIAGNGFYANPGVQECSNGLQYASFENMVSRTSNYFMEQESPFANGLKNLKNGGNRFYGTPVVQERSNGLQYTPPKNMTALTSDYYMEQQSLFANGLENLNISGKGFYTNPAVQECPNGLQYTTSLPFPSTTVNCQPNVTRPCQNDVAAIIPSNVDSIASSGSNYVDLPMKLSAPFPATSKKNPVSRPLRPPGFGNGSYIKMHDSVSKISQNGQLPEMDDYRWLDGYQTPSTKVIGLDNSLNHAAHIHPQLASSNNSGFSDALSFPFPGKQTLMMQAESTNLKKWQEFHIPENLKPCSEPQLPRGNQQSASLPQQDQAQSLWSGQHFE